MGPLAEATAMGKDAEFQFHLENQVSDYMQQGLNREEAEFRAHREFGALQLAKDECRDQRAFEPIDRLLRDLRYALPPTSL